MLKLVKMLTTFRAHDYQACYAVVKKLDKAMDRLGVCGLHVRIYPYHGSVPFGFRAAGSVLGKEFPLHCNINISFTEDLMTVTLGDETKYFVVHPGSEDDFNMAARHITSVFQAAVAAYPQQ